MWYLTFSSIVICILYVILSRVYLRRKWAKKDEQHETHISVKNELSTWDDNRKVFLNVGAMIAMACVLMASDLRFVPEDIPALDFDPMDDAYIPVSFTLEPEMVKPELKPEPEPKPEVKPPPVVYEYKIVDHIPTPPKPVVRKVKTPEPVNPVAKPKVIRKVKAKKKAKPIIKPPPPPKPAKVYESFEIDSPPAFPGGYSAMRAFIKGNVKYSAICRENNIEGKVFVKFVVNPEGKVTEVKLARGTNCQIDDEAIEVIKKLPKWEPGLKQNKAVSVQMIVPIDFQLE